MYSKPLKEYCIQRNIFHVELGQWLPRAKGQNLQNLMLPLLERNTRQNCRKTWKATENICLLEIKPWLDCVSSAAGLKSVLTARISWQNWGYQGWSKDDYSLLWSHKFYMKYPRLVMSAWSRTRPTPSVQHLAQRGKQTAWPCSILAGSLAIMNLHLV